MDTDSEVSNSEVKQMSIQEMMRQREVTGLIEGSEISADAPYYPYY
jgi:hypothetical protein